MNTVACHWHVTDVAVWCPPVCSEVYSRSRDIFFSEVALAFSTKLGSVYLDIVLLLSSTRWGSGACEICFTSPVKIILTGARCTLLRWCLWMCLHPNDDWPHPLCNHLLWFCRCCYCCFCWSGTGTLAHLKQWGLQNVLVLLQLHMFLGFFSWEAGKNTAVYLFFYLTPHIWIVTSMKKYEVLAVLTSCLCLGAFCDLLNISHLVCAHFQWIKHFLLTSVTPLPFLLSPLTKVFYWRNLIRDNVGSED